jgi:exodeoxyribonuclease III
MKLVSWNVNGVRSALRQGLMEFLITEKPDVLCLQETKAHPEDVEVSWPDGYHAHWHSADKRGYSGTLTIIRPPTRSVNRGLGRLLTDTEGRVLTVELDDFFLVNCYTPNSKRDLARLPYREKEWDPAFRKHLRKLEATKPVIFCGDLNVAHTEIDLANPKANTKNHGFTPQERAGFQALMDAGYIDTFRALHPGQAGHYTWWSPMGGARARNVGWRIDYFGMSAALRPRLQEAFIRAKVTGSDHCPVGIVLD